MDFSGLEKLSLVDYDDNISCTLFAAGCNFRCPFCHNSSLVLDPKNAPKIAWSEIYDYLSKRKNVLDAVTVTGGEPTLLDDLEDKIRQIKTLGYKVKLDSNGTNPALVKKLVKAGLIDYVAMDIKNSPEKYAFTTGVANPQLDKVKETAAFLLTKVVEFEFRTTIIDEFHTTKDFEEIGAWLEGTKRYYLQRYIDSENCISHGYHMVSKEKAASFKAVLARFNISAELRGYD